MNLICIYTRSPEQCPIDFQRVVYNQGDIIDIYSFKQADFKQLQVILLGSEIDSPIHITLATVPADYYVNIMCKSFQHAIIEAASPNKIHFEASYANITFKSEVHFGDFCINDQVQFNCNNGSIYADALMLNAGCLENVMPKLAVQETPMKVYDSFNIEFIGFAKDGYQLILSDGSAPFIPSTKFSTLKFVLTRALDKYDSLTLAFSGTDGESIEKVADIESFAVRNAVVHFHETWKNSGVTFSRKSAFTMLLDLIVEASSDYSTYPDNLFELPPGSTIVGHKPGMYCFVPSGSSYSCPGTYESKEFDPATTIKKGDIVCDDKGYDLIIAGTKDSSISFESSIFTGVTLKLTAYGAEEIANVKMDSENVPSSLILINVNLIYPPTSAAIKISHMYIEQASSLSDNMYDCDVLKIEQKSFPALSKFIDSTSRSIFVDLADLTHIVLKNDGIIDEKAGFSVKYTQYQTILLSTYAQSTTISCEVDKTKLADVRVPAIEVSDLGTDPVLNIDATFNPTWIQFNDMIKVTITPVSSRLTVKVQSTIFRENIFNVPESSQIIKLPNGYYCLYQYESSLSKCTENYSPVQYSTEKLIYSQLVPMNNVLRVVILDSNDQSMPIIDITGYGGNSISIRKNPEGSHQYLSIMPSLVTTVLDWFYVGYCTVKILEPEGKNIGCNGLELYDSQFTNMNGFSLNVFNQVKFSKAEEMISTIPYISKLTEGSKRNLRVPVTVSTIEMSKDSYKLGILTLDTTLFTSITFLIGHNITLSGFGVIPYTPSFELKSNLAIIFDKTLSSASTSDKGQISNGNFTVILKSTETSFPPLFEIPPASSTVIYDLGYKPTPDQSKAGGTSAGKVVGIIFLVIFIIAGVAIGGFFVYKKYFTHDIKTTPLLSTDELRP